MAQERSIKTVGIIAKRHRSDATESVRQLVDWLASRNVEVIVDADLIPLLGRQIKSAEKNVLVHLVDLLVVFGGDGTLLSVARLLDDSQALVLGVNLGSLGFLTETTIDEFVSVLECTLAGRCPIDQRQLLQVQLERKGTSIVSYRALNDAVINKGALARIVDLEIYIDKQFVSTFKADGLIISSPTGSTAYSLAAGGPIVYPSMEAFVITPICPHTLTNRPLVVSDQSTVEVTLISGMDVMLTIDGQVGLPLETRDVVKVQKAANPLRLILPANRNWFEVLRKKLKWGER